MTPTAPCRRPRRRTPRPGPIDSLLGLERPVPGLVPAAAWRRRRRRRVATWSASGRRRPAGSRTMLKAIDEAVAALQDGLLVAVPTDTVYGLAADPFHPGATERIFTAKKRPRDVELPVLVAEVAQALDLCLVEALPASARRLMERCWPGALTIVVPRRPGLSADLGSDEATVGIRRPAHPVVRQLCQRVGPLAVARAILPGGGRPAAARGGAGAAGGACA